MHAGLQSLFLGRAACAGCSALPCFSGIWGLLALQMIWGAVSLRFVTPSAQRLQTSSADSIQPVEPMERERMRSASKNTRGPRWEVMQKGWFMVVELRVCKLCLSSSFWELASGIQELVVLLPRAAGLVPATALGWAPAPTRAGGASVPSLPARGGSQPFLSGKVFAQALQGLPVITLSGCVSGVISVAKRETVEILELNSRFSSRSNEVIILLNLCVVTKQKTI